jgi:hypothetical protein
VERSYVASLPGNELALLHIFRFTDRGTWTFQRVLSNRACFSLEFSHGKWDHRCVDADIAGWHTRHVHKMKTLTTPKPSCALGITSGCKLQELAGVQTI